MKPYRLKHVPTGMYYRPGGGSPGNTLSIKGKVYNSGVNGLSYMGKKDKDYEFEVFTRRGSDVHVRTKMRGWSDYGHYFVKTKVKVSDFVKEEIDVTKDDSVLWDRAISLLKEAADSGSPTLKNEIKSFLQEIKNKK